MSSDKEDFRLDFRVRTSTAASERRSPNKDNNSSSPKHDDSSFFSENHDVTEPTFDVSSNSNSSPVKREPSSNLCLICKRKAASQLANSSGSPSSSSGVHSDTVVVLRPGVCCAPGCPGVEGSIPCPRIKKYSKKKLRRKDKAMMALGDSGNVNDDADFLISDDEDDDDTSDDVPLLLEGSPELNLPSATGDGSYCVVSGGSGNSGNGGSGGNLMSLAHQQELGAVGIAGNGMDHCHSTKCVNREKTTAKAKRKLMTACVLCLFFIAGEVTGGKLSNSIAIMSDAAHMLSDFASFCIALFSIWMGGKRPKKTFNYGYMRAEAIGALFTVVIIWFVTAILLYMACNRIANPGSFEVKPDAMMVVAGCAVVFNIVLGLLLHGMPGHAHSHGGGGASSSHSHDDGNGKHINVRAAAIHVLGDLIQSVGVLLSSVIIKMAPEAKLADPVCTLLFSVIVLCTTANVLRDTVRILMEGRPRDLDYDEVKEALASIDSVVKVHDLKIWSLTVDQLALTAHLAVNPELSANKERVLQTANKCLSTKFQISMTTIQVEDYKGQVMANCDDCNAIFE